MKVITETAIGRVDIDLEEYLVPSTGGYDSGGAVEQAMDLAEKNARAIGFILARMVENKTATFDEAQCAANHFGGEIIE